MPDIRPIRTFLDASHEALAAGASTFAAEAIAPRPEPADDAAARLEARQLLRLLGAADWLQPILDLDLRGCCVMREALGEASPLADAVFALQGLATTEPGAGSDVAGIATTAAREGSEYVLNGRKTLISNAGIADVYAVFASTDRGKGSKGISCFLIEATTPGLRFAGAQVLSAAHPLGELA